MWVSLERIDRLIVDRDRVFEPIPRVCVELCLRILRLKVGRVRRDTPSSRVVCASAILKFFIKMIEAPEFHKVNPDFLIARHRAFRGVENVVRVVEIRRAGIGLHFHREILAEAPGTDIG